MVAGVRVDTHDKWVGMSDDEHGGHGTFPKDEGHGSTAVNGRYQSG
jgi:hypothetical protein